MKRGVFWCIFVWNNKTNKMSSELITIRGIEFEVEFDYSPGEPEVRYYSDGSGYPGSDPELNVTAITHNESDFMEFFESDEEIEEAIWELINN